MSQHPVLSRSDIVEAVDLEVVRELVPEWKNKAGEPGLVILHQLSSDESMALSAELETKDKARDGMFYMLVYCARDEEGNRLFSVEDIALLRKKSMKVLNRLQRIALRLNSMDPASGVALKKD